MNVAGSVMVVAVVGCFHLVGAIEFCRKNKRGLFETICVAIGAIILWPLFSIGMMLRGYDRFWEDTWGDSKKDSSG